VEFGGVIKWRVMTSNHDEMYIIKQIIEILEQDGEETSDGECIDQIVQRLRYYGFKVLI